MRAHQLRHPMLAASLAVGIQVGMHARATIGLPTALMYGLDLNQ